MTKKKTKRFQLEIPVWNYFVYVVIGGTEQQACDYVSKKYGLDDYDCPDDGSRRASVTIYDNQWLLLWMPDLKDVSLLAHETLHITRFILQDKRQISLSAETEEVYTYLQEYLVKKILEWK